MKLGREIAYGIVGLLALAAKPSGTAMLLRDIAGAGRVPQSFLAKIFQKLARHGIVRSLRGAVRGYALSRSPKEIKLKEILLAIEGPDLFERCIFWSDRCADSNPCPLHEQWKEIKEKAIGKLVEKTTLADLMKKNARSRRVRRPFLRWRKELAFSLQQAE
ncbi:MAG: Rrf2 family transcriptional regulator [Deltaproteobacteria bacterium]|nr:Rrf2 family transcriptional regulator [Deltaproteobacteria bacterium]MDZ4342045.1 Rrf2 family transcriptional regulator [Candidatus Binatia bacterium]